MNDLNRQNFKDKIMEKINIETLKKISNRDNHNCFGCSSQNSYGLQMKFYTNDEALFSKIIVPGHLCGWNNFVHGGIISTMLDEVMSWSAIYLLNRIILTKSMTVDFLKPIFIGDELTVKGTVQSRTSERESIMIGEIYNSNMELSAQSKGTFSLFTLDAVRKLNFLEDHLIDEFAEIMNRN